MKRSQPTSGPASDPGFNPDQIALGIQQPWIELILRGIKTLEIRSQPTQIRGPIYLYASRRFSTLPAAALAAAAADIDLEQLPLGLLVGSVNIVDCRPATPRDAAASCVPRELLANHFAWVLDQPVRFDQPAPVRFLPYGVWFYPFKRRPTTRPAR